MKERKQNRLRGYDYSADNLYFVTTCVQNRVRCFGEIIRTGFDEGIGNNVGTGRDLSLRGINNDTTWTGHDPSVQRTGRDLSVHDLSVHDLSLREQKMVLNEYGEIAERQWFWLGEQYPYVILHAFVVMPNHVHGIIEINRNIVGTGRDLSVHDPSAQRTGHDLSLQKIKSLSELMGAHKTTVSKQIHLAGYVEFAWQRSFYEHIIRDQESFEKISDYIVSNPSKWEEDRFYK